MFKIIKLCFFILVVYRYGDNHISAQTNIISKLPDQIEHELSVLQTNKSFESIHPIVLSIRDFSNVQLKDRKQQLRIWLKILSCIDTNETEINSHFLWNVAPPPDGVNGVQHPAGVAPETLKDPDARSNYMESIRINNQGIINNNSQILLHNLNDNASAYFEAFLKSNYASNEADVKEIKSSMGEFKLSTERTNEINSVISLSQ